MKGKIPFYSNKYNAIEESLVRAQEKIEEIYDALPDEVAYEIGAPDILEWWDRIRFKTYVYILKDSQKANVVIFAKSDKISDLAYRLLYSKRRISGRIYGCTEVSYRYACNRTGKYAKIANQMIENDSDDVYVAEVECFHGKKMLTIRETSSGKTYSKEL